MSNPSVTATIDAKDLASPKIRELIATLKQAEKVAKEPDGGNLGGKYANSFNQANAAAQKRLGILHQVQAAHKAIAATVAGYTAMKVVHGGVDAIKHALPYLREDTSIRARTGCSESDIERGGIGRSGHHLGCNRRRAHKVGRATPKANTMTRSAMLSTRGGSVDGVAWGKKKPPEGGFLNREMLIDVRRLLHRRESYDRP